MNKVPKAVLIILLVVVGLIMLGCSTQDTERDNQSPDFALHNLEGKLVSLSDFRGKPVMLNFWTTGCPYCIRQMPYLQQVYEEWLAKGLVIQTINIGETSSEVKELL